MLHNKSQLSCVSNDEIIHNFIFTKKYEFDLLVFM